MQIIQKVHKVKSVFGFIETKFVSIRGLKIRKPVFVRRAPNYGQGGRENKK